MQNTLQPTQQSERADILDILRGFAILGIFINNSINFSGIGFLPRSYFEQFPTWKVDQVLLYLQTVLIEGKFYSLFSLLFGIGFSIILVSTGKKGISPLKIFYRRLIILMLLGLAHTFLLWDGDILLLYGIVGCLLPAFRNVSDKTLLTWAVCLLLLPVFIDFIRIIRKWNPGGFLLEIAQQVDKSNGVPVDETAGFYLFRDGSGYANVLRWVQGGFFYRYEYLLDSNRFPKVLGVFLLGFYAGRKLIYANLDAHRSTLSQLRKWGFLIGLPASVAMAILEFDHKGVPSSWLGLLDTISYCLSVVPLSLAYASTLTLWWMKKHDASWLARLAPVGRMALTNYLLQTILSILIFYNLGLGLGTRVGYGYVLLVVFAVYGFQVLYSTIWFRYFNYGPFEWVWRQLTYLKRLPMLKPPARAQ